MKAREQGTFNPVPLPPAGSTVARCYSVIHIGTIPHYFKNEYQGDKDMVYVTWELPEYKAVFSEEKGPEPFVIGKEFTLSTKENSNFAQLIKAWRNKAFTEDERKGFDPSVMLNKTALMSFNHKRKSKFVNMEISVVTNENTSLNMVAIMPKPGSMVCPPMINPKFLWDWESISSGKEKFDPAKFAKMPKWLRKRTMESAEFKQYGANLYKEEGNDASQAATPATEVVDNDGWQ